jgi:hypothetical protein
MKNNNFTLGLALICLGSAYFLRNFDISMLTTFIIFGGLYFLYEYTNKKQQPHFVFGVVLTATGTLMLLRNLHILRFDITGEMFLAALGIVFLFIYFRKGIIGFIFPGYILPAIAIYSLIDNSMNDSFIWPSFFILLGLAFYMIYFTAYIGRSSWPLIPGTILILFGLIAFGFVLEILSIEMLRALSIYQNYIIAALIVLAGVGLLYKGLRK